jgi:hypothetical protein
MLYFGGKGYILVAKVLFWWQILFPGGKCSILVAKAYQLGQAGSKIP